MVMGANIGTTTGAWIVAGFGLKVDIGAYAMPILVFGVVLLFQKSRSKSEVRSYLRDSTFTNWQYAIVRYVIVWYGLRVVSCRTRVM